MNDHGTIADLFKAEPARWGLRGDPPLWREMRARFEQTLLTDSEEALVARIEEAFQTLTGIPISHREYYFIKRLDHGSMSGGVISPEFWRDTVIPMMRARFSGESGAGSSLQQEIR